MKNLSFLNKILFLVNSLLATLLLLSFCLPFIAPKTISALVVLSIFVPLLVLINGFFIIYWILNLKKQFLLSTFILVIGMFISSPIYKFKSNNSSLNNDLKIMSFNVKAFDLFTNKKDSLHPKKGFDFIIENDPDILLFQEFFNYKELPINFPYKYVKTKSERNYFGMAIFSKYKIVNSGSLNFKNTSNNIIFSDILKEKDTIRIYNVHLESLKIKPYENNFGEENSEKLIKRIANSFQKQAVQTNQFLEHEKGWNGKKIICGDFNNTAYSWVYKQISKNKKDAFIEAGKGFGKTFDYWFPMRIDFILTDATATINKFTTFSEEFSDHYPIQAKINW